MLVQRFIAMVLIGSLTFSAMQAADDGLIAHWKLQGDCRDYSGKQNHGTNHRVDLLSGSFSGRDAYVEVTSFKSLQLGHGDFSIAADLWTGKDLRGTFGTLVSKFDSARRRGFELALCTNSSGYNGQSGNRQLCIGLDDGTNGTWTDCGRPNGEDPHQ
jgi:hypothetical protein